MPKVIIADEWSSMMSPTYAKDLAMDRKHLLSHHLFNQMRAQLRAVDKDLAEIVATQMQYEFFFTLDADDQEHVQTFSKEVEGTLKNRTVSSFGFSHGTRGVMGRALELNKLLEVSSTAGTAIMVRKIKDGFQEPIRLFFDHEISREAFDHLSSIPFPLRPEPPKLVTKAPSGWRHAPRDEAWEAATRALYEERLAWESGQ